VKTLFTKENDRKGQACSPQIARWAKIAFHWPGRCPSMLTFRWCNSQNWFYGDWPVGQKIRSHRQTMAEERKPPVQCAGARHPSAAIPTKTTLQEMGLIRASYEVFKGEGELVFYCEHLQTVKCPNAARCAGKTEK
jgi:hypothetical protein